MLGYIEKEKLLLPSSKVSTLNRAFVRVRTFFVSLTNQDQSNPCIHKCETLFLRLGGVAVVLVDVPVAIC